MLYPRVLYQLWETVAAQRHCHLNLYAVSPVTFCPQQAEFPNEHVFQRFALVPKRRTWLFLGSIPGPRVASHFAFVLT